MDYYHSLLFFYSMIGLLLASFLLIQNDGGRERWRHRDTARKVVSVNVFYWPYSRDLVNPTNGTFKLPVDSTKLLNRYFTPLVNVILNWKYLLPEWEVWVYITKDHPYASQLRLLGAEVIEMEFDPNRWSEATSWRFLVEDRTDVYAWASRESESPPTYQDAAVLRHWLKCNNNYSLHAIHMKGSHQNLNAGLFGAKRGKLTELLNTSMHDGIKGFFKDLDKKRSSIGGSRYGDDQRFLSVFKQHLKLYGVAYVEDTLLKTRRFCLFGACIELPAYPGKPDGFTCSMNSMKENQLILCNYTEPPFCRKVDFLEKSAWRLLFEACTGTDFFSGSGVQVLSSEMPECPYSSSSSSIWATDSPKCG